LVVLSKYSESLPEAIAPHLLSCCQTILHIRDPRLISSCFDVF